MRASALRAGDIVRIRDQRWIVMRHAPGEQGALLDVCGRDRSNWGARACFVLPCEPCEQLPQSRAPRIVRPRAWRRHLRAALATATPSPAALRTRPPHAFAVFPFQLAPAMAVMRGLATRILIADEVGLGKTVQAGLIISEVRQRQPDGHILIVTPAGLRAQWSEELRERLGLEAMVFDASALAHHGWHSNANPWTTHPLIITSLDYVKRPEVLRSLESLVWDVVVFDEAHALSGRSDRATAASALAERSRIVVLLSATPHSGDEQAFARLCSTGDLQHLFPLLVFRRARRDVGLIASRRTVSLRVRPTAAEAAMHRAVAAYAQLIWIQKGVSSPGARLVAGLLCRRASSSASSLARSVERRLVLLTRISHDDLVQTCLPFDDIVADDEEPGVALAEGGLHDQREEGLWLNRILALAQSAQANESKLHALGRYLQRTNEPAIVFTEYRDTLGTLAARLSHRSPLLLHGGLSAAERHDVARRFNSGSAGLLLATDAAGEGLNLHRHCRLIINLELPWTPVRLEQRIGRVERIGQTRRVHAVHLLAAGTSEEQAVARLLLRGDRATRALNDLRTASCFVDEVAELAIGERAPSSRLEAPTLPRNVITRDLSDDALVEASRLQIARDLASDGSSVLPDPRPLVTSSRRRQRERQSFWIYRLGLTDEDGELVWDTLVAIAAHLSPAPPAPRDVRARLSTSLDDLSSTVAAAQERLRDEAIASLQPALHLAAARERAIEHVLTERRARLSAALLQRGLFDRRNERTSAAQAAIIEEALARCTSRLHDIERSGRITADSTLGFVLLRR